MKIVAIVQARMGSNRLPGKVLRELVGFPMIYHTLTRLKKARYIDEIILATSDTAADDALADYVASIGIKVFRGEEEEVLRRYKQAADLCGADVVVRITGDCPVIDPVLVDHVITKYLISDMDYVRLDVPATYLRGFDVEVFKKEALDKVYEIVYEKGCKEEQEEQMYREHVTYYMYTHPQLFNIGKVASKETLDSSYNLSVDTIEDFKRVEKWVAEEGYSAILKKVKEELKNE